MENGNIKQNRAIVVFGETSKLISDIQWYLPFLGKKQWKIKHQVS